MTERDIYLAVKAWLDPNEWAILPQVRNGTGVNRKARYADAVAVSCFPSKGIVVHGFEFKDSRSDWLRELKDGAKADEIGRFCGKWSVVASSPDIVKADEVPPMWGWLVIDEGVVKVKKKAPLRDAAEPTWAFFAALMRAAMTAIPEADVQRRIAEAVAKEGNRAWSEHQEQQRRDRDRQVKEGRELWTRVAAFEQASGVKIGGYESAEKIGEAVKFVLAGGLDCRNLEYARNSANAVVQDIDRVLAELRRNAEVTGQSNEEVAPPCPA